MRRHSEAVKADLRRRMSPRMRQSITTISKELGNDVLTRSNWSKTLQLESEVGAFYWTVPAPDIVNPGREEQGLVSV